MEELKTFYGSFEIKTARQFKDAVKTLANYAEQIPDDGDLELDSEVYSPLTQTFWTVANSFNKFIKDYDNCQMRRDMQARHEKEE